MYLTINIKTLPWRHYAFGVNNKWTDEYCPLTIILQYDDGNNVHIFSHECQSFDLEDAILDDDPVADDKIKLVQNKFHAYA